jgi:hypothetical protein
MYFLENPAGAADFMGSGMGITGSVFSGKAECLTYDGLANYLYSRSGDSQVMLPGEEDHYKPLCSRCFIHALNKQQ